MSAQRMHASAREYDPVTTGHMLYLDPCPIQQLMPSKKGSPHDTNNILSYPWLQVSIAYVLDRGPGMQPKAHPKNHHSSYLSIMVKCLHFRNDFVCSTLHQCILQV